RVERVAGGRLPGRERTARAGEADEQRRQRRLHRLEELLREPTGRHHTEGVAVPAGILGGDQPLLAGEADAQRSALREERRRVSLLVLAVPQVAAAAEEIVQLVGRPRRPRELALDVGERRRVDQL